MRPGQIGALQRILRVRPLTIVMCDCVLCSGLYHAGVIKALDEAALLPRIISGSSVGAIIAAIVGQFTNH